MAGPEQIASVQNIIANAPTQSEQPVRAIHRESGRKIIATDPSSGNALKDAIADANKEHVEAYTKTSDEPTKSK